MNLFIFPFVLFSVASSSFELHAQVDHSSPIAINVESQASIADLFTAANVSPETHQLSFGQITYHDLEMLVADSGITPEALIYFQKKNPTIQFAVSSYRSAEIRFFPKMFKVDFSNNVYDEIQAIFNTHDHRKRKISVLELSFFDDGGKRTKKRRISREDEIDIAVDSEQISCHYFEIEILFPIGNPPGRDGRFSFDVRSIAAQRGYQFIINGEPVTSNPSRRLLDRV